MSGYVPTVPLDYIDSLHDPGGWRARKITHWHLVRDEQPITINGRANEARFSTARIQGMVVGSANKVAYNPREALLWLADQYASGLAGSPDPASAAARRGYGSPDAWLFSLTCSWDTLAGGSLITPAGGGLEIRPNISLDAHCYPMTTALCRTHSTGDGG